VCDVAIALTRRAEEQPIYAVKDRVCLDLGGIVVDHSVLAAVCLATVALFCF
jgi:hypothetical protein